MAVSAYPYDGRATTDAEYSILLDAALGGSGMLHAPTVSVSGMNVTLNQLDGIVRGHRFVSVSETVPIVSTSSARTAAIIARLDYSKSPDIVEIAVKYGAGSNMPALTQTREGIFEMPLYRVAVAANANALGTGNVTGLFWLHRSPSSSVILVQQAEPTSPAVGTVWMW